MPDPSRSRKPPPLVNPPPPPASERDREEFEEALAGVPACDLDTRRPTPAEPAPPTPAMLLRELRTGRRRVGDDCVVSVRQKTQPVARRELEQFLRARQQEGRQFVKVIHGKGFGSPEGGPVLPRRVPEWLAEWKSDLVAVWEPAPAREGGSGALHVVLTPWQP